MNKMKKDIENSRVYYKGKNIPIHMSFGYCNVDKNILKNDSDLTMLRDTITDIADNYLYVEKNGKNDRIRNRK